MPTFRIHSRGNFPLNLTVSLRHSTKEPDNFCVTCQWFLQAAEFFHQRGLQLQEATTLLINKGKGEIT